MKAGGADPAGPLGGSPSGRSRTETNKSAAATSEAGATDAPASR